MRLMVQVDTVATTLTLAEQNHAEELKRVCLEFASRNLSTVMCSEGYHHMISSCPQLQVLMMILIIIIVIIIILVIILIINPDYNNCIAFQLMMS